MFWQVQKILPTILMIEIKFLKNVLIFTILIIAAKLIDYRLTIYSLILNSVRFYKYEIEKTKGN